MNIRYGTWAGKQGARYALWQTPNGYEVEQVWGIGNGVIFRADTVRSCKKFLSKECMANRIMQKQKGVR